MDCRAAAQYVLAAPSQKFHFVDTLNHNVHGYAKDIDGIATYVWVYQELRGTITPSCSSGGLGQQLPRKLDALVSGERTL
jgi:hypothetical protein